MIYLLLSPLRETFSFFNIFSYITFRAVYAGVTALIISFLFGKYTIRKLSEFKTGETIRKYTPEGHEKKKGTPSMGGILIIISISISTILWGNLFNRNVIILLFSLILLGVFGFIDDYFKMKKKKGIEGRYKLAGQILLTIIIGIILFKFPSNGDLLTTETNALFFKNIIINFSWFYIPLIFLVILGSSNAVNLTDGLDGLAPGTLSVSFASFSILAYIVGNIKAATYLNIGFDPLAAEITIFTTAAVGACLGFLWFNSHPASVFMGDTGSLSLGGALGITAILIKQELLLIIIGGVFVIEAMSVILQVGFFKLTKGRRLFKIAPIHHHFEKSGIPESKIVVRFWLLAVLFALIGLSTLKLR